MGGEGPKQGTFHSCALRRTYDVLRKLQLSESTYSLMVPVTFISRPPRSPATGAIVLSFVAQYANLAIDC